MKLSTAKPRAKLSNSPFVTPSVKPALSNELLQLPSNGQTQVELVVIPLSRQSDENHPHVPPSDDAAPAPNSTNPQRRTTLSAARRVDVRRKSTLEGKRKDSIAAEATRSLTPPGNEAGSSTFVPNPVRNYNRQMAVAIANSLRDTKKNDASNEKLEEARRKMAAMKEYEAYRRSRLSANPPPKRSERTDPSSREQAQLRGALLRAHRNTLQNDVFGHLQDGEIDRDVLASALAFGDDYGLIRNSGGRGRPGIEDMSYEALCNLEDVAVGVPEEFLDSLPMYVHSESASSTTEAATCSVCLCEYEHDDMCCTLFCLHTFHFECIVPWLQGKKTCPVCKRDVLEAREAAQLAEVQWVAGHTAAESEDGTVG